jgi:maltose O-acetyltransferase
MLRDIYFKWRLRLASRSCLVRTKLYGIGFKRFGRRNTIDFPVKIRGKENVSVGDDCSINAFVHIWGYGGVEIGDNVMIASHVAISSLTHDYTQRSMRFSEVIRRKVVIEDDVWIGSGAIILPGVRIGKGAVVGAASVVTKDVAPYAIVVGSPAVLLKMRNIGL